ncbi:2-methylcitrate dehydratase [Peribacillus sp. B-H-3]|uniref:2-methylcitrate dehydratase n=1 Tax=Peribacillus sp. B-H-3 TaxID=3400420 RepID=UPI003B01DDC9
MSYIDFKALVKKINLKPKGVKEIVLEVSDSGLDGKLDSLSEMIDQKAEIQLESLIVNYSVTVDLRTNEPLTRYTVDGNGTVSELKNENQQLEADLGLPKEKPKTKEEKKEIDREPIDKFILEGLAPNYDDLPNDFAELVKRRLEGESFIKLANELDISSGKVAEMMDDYRQRVAPLAQAWWDWKEGEPNSVNTEKLDEPVKAPENADFLIDKEPDKPDQADDKDDTQDGVA